MRSKIFYPDQRNPKEVTNLGWIMRNWRKVKHFAWYDVSPEMRQETVQDGFFLASLKDGRIYYSDFASYSVFVHWLNRPIFRSLPIFITKWQNQNGFWFTIGEYERMVS